MITRRAFLRAAARLPLLGALPALYGLGEPLFGLRVKRYALTPPKWPQDLRLRVAVIADPHACEPWMTAARLSSVVDLTNDLSADCVALLGDYVATHSFQTPTPPKAWAGALARLRAPLGVHAVLGNHDWWADEEALIRSGGTPFAGLALRDAGVALYQNEAVRLQKDGKPFWLVGLDDQIAGVDDAAAAFARVDDDAPVILLAHEPDIFREAPTGAALTLCGHLHAGQCNLSGWTPFVPAKYQGRYVYGHIVEENRHLIVSGGLGCSVVPMRIGAPPEIVVIDLGGAEVAKS